MFVKQSLDELKAGNRRFVAHLHHEVPTDNHNRQHELIINQKPIAVIVGCSDARVPPELVQNHFSGCVKSTRIDLESDRRRRRTTTATVGTDETLQN